MIIVDPEELDRNRQMHVAAAHDVNRLVLELPVEHLSILAQLLDSITTAAKPRMIAAFMSGRTTEALQSRFNVCAACGQNHDEQLQELVGPEQVPAPTPPWVETRQKTSVLDWTPLGSDSPMKHWEEDRMRQFNLDDVRDEDTKELLGFVCKNCGMRYQSIQDRMIDGPTECSGCYEKVKHG